LSGMVARMSTNSKGTEVAAAGVSGQAQRLSLFGPPLLLEGEDSAAYDELVGRICAAVRPADVIDEIFIADLVALQWEVLRWRRLKWSLIRARGLAALESFLAGRLDDDLCSELVADRLTEILRDHVPQEYPDSLPTTARMYARNEVDKNNINEVLACFNLNMDRIRCDARARKAEELVRDYQRREPDAVKLTDELFASAGMSMDTFMTKVLGDKIDDIERIDRLTAIAETRRNAAQREIDRRRAVLSKTLRRSVHEIEDDDFADGELVRELPAAE